MRAAKVHIRFKSSSSVSSSILAMLDRELLAPAAPSILAPPSTFSSGSSPTQDRSSRRKGRCTALCTKNRSESELISSLMVRRTCPASQPESRSRTLTLDALGPVRFAQLLQLGQDIVPQQVLETRAGRTASQRLFLCTVNVRRTPRRLVQLHTPAQRRDVPAAMAHSSRRCPCHQRRASDIEHH